MGSAMTKRFFVDDDGMTYSVVEPMPQGNRVAATHIVRHDDATLFMAAPILADALAELLHELDPLGVAAPDSARCKLCGVHPSTHARDCVVVDAREALDIARGRL